MEDKYLWYSLRIRLWFFLVFLVLVKVFRWCGWCRNISLCSWVLVIFCVIMWCVVLFLVSRWGYWWKLGNLCLMSCWLFWFVIGWLIWSWCVLFLMVFYVFRFRLKCLICCLKNLGCWLVLFCCLKCWIKCLLIVLWIVDGRWWLRVVFFVLMIMRKWFVSVSRFIVSRFSCLLIIMFGVVIFIWWMVLVCLMRCMSGFWVECIDIYCGWIVWIKW